MRKLLLAPVLALAAVMLAGCATGDVLASAPLWSADKLCPNAEKVRAAAAVARRVADAADMAVDGICPAPW